MGTSAPETLGKTSVPAQDFKAKIQVAEKQFEKISHDAGTKVGTVATKLADSATEYVEKSRHYVKENPGKSVAIAAAAGMLAGGLLTLMMSRQK